ncbi:YbdK family carboxylate-amine ligase [Skermania sp. ID1734]|uniref:carboxylate-amine ligase n=1 Tax=Skermania sp. ID1734 TaxID=2597516 RepID=UPI0011815943|nr:YbdK family carboxylate-amine ligase [Skermania sp. ID1734]TSD99494.1 YbdK family carboxylate-amine ligase [Skermania sp. ID1734]
MTLTGSGRTVGVEEEFALVDAAGRLAPRRTAVLRRLVGSVGIFKPELHTAQVESVTPVRTDVEALRADLTTARSELAAAAAAEGCRVVPAGMPVGPAMQQAPAPRAPGPDRHARIRQLYAGAVGDYCACGCHVHVGVVDLDTAVAVVNHLRPWLPSLIALSANSPFQHGLDTGYASWRVVEQSKFPGFGIPPYLASAADYRERVGRLVECGILADERMSVWLARPSQVFTTVEVRAADVGLRVADALLQAVLVRGLVGSALRDLAAGIEGPVIDNQIGAAAVWSAARYGLDGPAIDPINEIQVPARTLVETMFAAIAPDLDELGDLDLARALLDAVLREGNGAYRQRCAGIDAVLDRFALAAPEPVVETEQMVAERCGN